MPLAGRSLPTPLVHGATCPQSSCWRPDSAGSPSVGCDPSRSTGHLHGQTCQAPKEKPEPEAAAARSTSQPQHRRAVRSRDAGPLRVCQGCPAGLCLQVSHTENCRCHHGFCQSPCPAFSPAFLCQCPPAPPVLWASSQPQALQLMTPLCSVLIK